MYVTLCVQLNCFDAEVSRFPVTYIVLYYTLFDVSAFVNRSVGVEEVIVLQSR